MSRNLHDFARRVWSDQPGRLLTVARWLTVPASFGWGAASALRNTLYDKHLLRITSTTVPVFSIGSLSVGGAGKTPIAAWLAGWLLERGHHVALLHGGYARDEPELHRRWHPELRVYAQRDRLQSAARAVADGADVLILDDGFQHRRLHRDVDVVLVAAESFARRRWLLPRGPHREPDRALARADVVVVTRKTLTPGAATEVARQVRPMASAGAVLVVAAISPVGWRNAGERTGAPQEGVMVAGIARPELFADNVREVGVRAFDRLWFPDHHEYDARDAERILRAAGRLPILTTGKDALKLESLIAPDRMWVLEQEVRIETGSGELVACLEKHLHEDD